jgi:hypothetical protein
MNNRGWGLDVMLRLCSVIGIALIVVAIIYNFYYKKNVGGFDKDGVDTEYNTTDENYQYSTDTRSEDDTYVTESKKTYDDILEEMKVASDTYVTNHYNNLKSGSVRISLDSLIEDKLLDTIYALDDNTVICNGYVDYSINGGSKEYKSYLKCGDLYKTDGYQE